MKYANTFVYQILHKSSRGLAGYAAAEFLEQYPAAAESAGPDSFAVWQDWLSGRVEELAAVIAAGRPTEFAAQVRSAAMPLRTRGVAAEHLRAGLVCLRGVLQSELPQSDRDVALQAVDEALAGFDDQLAELAQPLSADTPHGRLTAQYLLAVLEGDRRRASELLLAEARRGQPVADLYLHVLLPAQEELGRMWMVEEINVAEEHFASATTKRVIAQLALHAHFQPANGKTMIAASVAGNQHDIGIQLVGEFFEMDGWRTIHLGADMPTPDLVQAVEFFEADLIGLSASRAPQIPTVQQTISDVRDCNRGSLVKILVGGVAFAGSGDLAQRIGADSYAANAAEAVAIGRRLVGLSEPPEKNGSS
jgi:MerR family transcriptional regulator, light-induced transcriptional regulator